MRDTDALGELNSKWLQTLEEVRTAVMESREMVWVPKLK